MATIEELLKSMLTLKKENKQSDFIKGLENSRDTWARIGAQDSFDELEFESEDAKTEFLKDWIVNNPYQAIN